MSRYVWPTDKAERLALICANLRVHIPPGRAKGPKKGRGRPRKDDEELELDEEMEVKENAGG